MNINLEIAKLVDKYMPAILNSEHERMLANNMIFALCETFANQSKWIDVSEQPTPDFDGEYLCLLEIEQECHNVWKVQRVVNCVFNRWVLTGLIERVIAWQPLPNPPTK